MLFRLTVERDSERLTSIRTLRTHTHTHTNKFKFAGRIPFKAPTSRLREEEEQWAKGHWGGKRNNIANKFRFYLVPNNSANLQIPPHTNTEFHIRALYSKATGYVPNFVPNFYDPMRANVPALRATA